MDSGRKQIKPSGKRPVPKGAPNAAPAKVQAKTPVKTQKAKPAPAKTAPRNKVGSLWQRLTAGPTTDTLDLLRYILFIEVMVGLVLTLTLTYAKFNIPRDPIPFAINTKTGKPEALFSLTTPTKTQQAIMSWTGSASADILNFGFHNVFDRLQSTQKYFTDDGWESFKEAVKASGIIDRITEKQQVITAAPTGTPVILSTKENEQYGREWTVQVPIYVTVLSGKETDSKKRTLTLVLVTVPPEKNISGLGIDRWLETQ